MAMAIGQPVFVGDQRFAISAGWGEYQNQNAAGVSVAGVIARDLVGAGSTLVLDGGVGVGQDGGNVAGKARLTLGFGR